jgi:hypothetical protein
MFPYPGQYSEINWRFFLTMVEVWSIGFHALHVLSCSLYSTTTIDAAILVPFLGEAERMIKDILIGATQTPYFAYKRRVQLSADNLS